MTEDSHTDTPERLASRMMHTRLAAWIGVNLIMTILAMLVIFTAANSELLCPFHTLSGYDCPGCGGSRMVLALARGDIYQAFRWNNFLFLTMPPMFILYFWQSARWIKTGDLSIWLGRLLFAYGIAFLLFGLIRNLGICPFMDPTMV